jgi:hypothetical protein
MTSLGEVAFKGKNKGVQLNGTQCDEQICQYFASDSEQKPQQKLNNKYVTKLLIEE